MTVICPSDGKLLNAVRDPSSVIQKELIWGVGVGCDVCGLCDVCCVMCDV
jgi:hypothetical protein